MTEIKRDILNGQKVEVNNKVQENGVAYDVVEKEYKLEIVWFSVVMNTMLHLLAIYGLFLQKQWKTIAFGS